MLSRILTPMICMSLFGLSACGIGDVASKTSIQKLSDSVDLADSWLSRARSTTNSTSTSSSLIDDVRDVLSTRKINLVPAGDTGPCADNTATEFTLAYIKSPVTTNPINVCRETMSFSESIIAQVLIHEGTHGANVTNECTTTSHELDILRLANQRPFKNAYVETCPGLNTGDFVILEDGSEFPVPVRYWREDAPQGARYIRAQRKERSVTTWFKQHISFLFSL